MSDQEPLGTSRRGKPLYNPKKKLSVNIPSMWSPPVAQAIDELGDEMHLTRTQILRLAVYHHLRRLGKMTPELEQDATWESLRKRGLV